MTEEVNHFPNPVINGGNINLKMKIVAVGETTPGGSLIRLSAIISSKMLDSNGRFVDQQNVGTVQSMSTYQNVPIWNNINAPAAGVYSLEVTVSVGDCG